MQPISEDFGGVTTLLSPMADAFHNVGTLKEQPLARVHLHWHKFAFRGASLCCHR